LLVEWTVQLGDSQAAFATAEEASTDRTGPSYRSTGVPRDHHETRVLVCLFVTGVGVGAVCCRALVGAAAGVASPVVAAVLAAVGVEIGSLGC
jgi:hypothetical protein